MAIVLWFGVLSLVSTLAGFFCAYFYKHDEFKRQIILASPCFVGVILLLSFPPDFGGDLVALPISGMLTMGVSLIGGMFLGAGLRDYLDKTAAEDPLAQPGTTWGE